MPARFTATENAFEKGIETVKPAAAIKMIDGWIEALADVDIPGAKGIARDLEGLKKALSNDEPDGDKVKALLAKLAQGTTKIAGKAEEKVQPKLQQLGEAMQGVGGDAAEEDEDEEEGETKTKSKAK